MHLKLFIIHFKITQNPEINAYVNLVRVNIMFNIL